MVIAPALLMSYREAVIRHMRRSVARHYTVEDDLRDAFSTAVIEALQTPDLIDPATLEDWLLCRAYKALNKVAHIYKQESAVDPCQMDVHPSMTRKQQEHKFVEGPRVPQLLDYRKLDQRFRNHLSDRTRILWDLRCAQTPHAIIKQTLQRDANWIAVTEYHLRHAYIKWARHMQIVDAIPTHYLKGKVTRSVYTLMVQGYCPTYIAHELSITVNNCNAVFFRLRQRYQQDNPTNPS